MAWRVEWCVVLKFVLFGGGREVRCGGGFVTKVLQFVTNFFQYVFSIVEGAWSIGVSIWSVYWSIWGG